jgi:phytoene synthase
MTATTVPPAAPVPVTNHAADLALSHTYCLHLTRQAARNFYHGLKLLPLPKRQAMFAVYAWMRLVDDIADDVDQRTPAQRRTELSAWRAATAQVYTGQTHGLDHPVWPAFASAVREYGIPEHIFADMIAGQIQDLDYQPFATFKEVHHYCYRVASTAGLASVYVWGFSGGEATLQLAIDRGIAFQLTNILRDLREDAQRGRIYIPMNELEKYSVHPEAFATTTAPWNVRSLLNYQVDRAMDYFRRSEGLEARVSPDCRPALLAMTMIYFGVLKRIRRDPAAVLTKRVRLPLLQKLWIAYRSTKMTQWHAD